MFACYHKIAIVFRQLTMTKDEKKLLAEWIRECEKLFRNAPTTKGRGGRVIATQVDDQDGYQQDWNQLGDDPCAALETSLESEGGRWRLGGEVQTESNFTIFSQPVLIAMCRRAIKGLFQDTADGPICLKLLTHFPMLPPPPISLSAPA
jgi:hypothetical protein